MMRLKGKIPLLIVAVLAWIVIISSCANQGMPIGGPKDTIPPVLVETNPEYKGLNFDGEEVEFTFDEYIIPDAVSEFLVVSPPLDKKPLIRTKGKSLIIKFNEELKDSTTYSMDFKNSIVDNNEKNPFESLRFSFSTGDVYDSLRVAGKLMNAFNLEPVEGGLVFLHSNLHDSAVYTVKPDYIAKTDEKGLFLIDNIKPDTFHIFSINDANSDMLYNEGAEEIAFMDTLIVPYSEYKEEIDTLVKDADSLLVMGHTRFFPAPVYLRQFSEDIFEQYLDSYKRDTRYKCIFLFNESVKDTFDVQLVGMEDTAWYQLEPNPSMDSIVMWIADTTVAKIDSLVMEISYFQLDTASQIFLQKDTIDMFFTDPELKETKKRRRERKEDEEEKPEPIPQFSWQINAGSSEFDLNQDLLLSSPEPIEFFDSTKILLYHSEDTLKTPLGFIFQKDTSAYRRYRISYRWESKTGYTLEVDSAASSNIYGITNRELIKRFTTRDEDYYGTLLLKLTGVKCPIIAQLLENSDDEELVTEHRLEKEGVVIFNFLSPDKYKLKVVYDENGNGKWDAGSFQDNVQPEKVAYINEVIKVRSNWTEEITWDMKVDLTFNKNIRDYEEEERLRKEAEEKARRERENPQRERMQNDNMMQGGMGPGRGGIIRR